MQGPHEVRASPQVLRVGWPLPWGDTGPPHWSQGMLQVPGEFCPHRPPLLQLERVPKTARQTDKPCRNCRESGKGGGSQGRTPWRHLQPCCPQTWQGAPSAGTLRGPILLLVAGRVCRCWKDPQKRQEPRRPRARPSSAASARLMRVVVSLTLWAASTARLSDQFSSSSSSRSRLRQRWWPWGRGGLSACRDPVGTPRGTPARAGAEVGTVGEQ